MFKKFLLVLTGAILTLVIILGVNTVMLDNHQIEPGEAPVVDIDRENMIDRFSRSIQFQTISTEDILQRDMDEFRAFLQFIENEFPLVHENLEKKLFNELTPLYRWEGTNSELDPILLMGHYDVVPVDSSDIDSWIHDPFSGAVDDGYIWGRGTLDNKFNVMGLLETAEYLLEHDFQPARDIYFSFGHDEEIGGTKGAREVARYFADQDIRLQFLLDEGGGVIENALPVDNPIALVGIAEKGYLSLQLTARSPGGHSSTPPEEKAIVMISNAIIALEENQLPAQIDGATEKMFDAIGNKLPFTERVLFANRWISERLLLQGLSSNSQTAPLVRTTTAPTMLKAGVKDNVMPTKASVVVNFRLLPGDTNEHVKEHVRRVINDERIAVELYGEDLRTPASPVSPINTSDYRSIQQAVMDTYRDVYVAPYLVVGATDSRHFTSITNSIYRFSPFKMDVADMERIHGTNERVSVESYLNSIEFYSHLIKMTASE